ncbi:type II secretion system protein M [Myxococcota bacterium]|nr:type II secretion system protein M [Myxococcota bacterium]
MNIKQWLRPLANTFNNLSSREQILVGTAGTAALVSLIYFMAIAPVLESRTQAEQRISTAELQLQGMTRLRRQFDDVSQRLEAVEQRIGKGPRGNLRTTLENLAKKANVKIESMEPQTSPANPRYRETKFELGLANVTLEQAVTLLHEIESHRRVLSVKSLRMRPRADQPQFLDLTFTVSSFEPS